MGVLMLAAVLVPYVMAGRSVGRVPACAARGDPPPGLLAGALARVGEPRAPLADPRCCKFELPLISRSILSVSVLAFALCFDEAVLAYFLSSP